MPVTSYTVYSNRPRLFFRDTDVATITTRTNTSSQWQDTWDNIIIPNASSIESTQSHSTIASNDNVANKAMTLSLTGLIDSISGNKIKAIGLAEYIAANLSTIGASEKWALLAMAYIFDLLYADMTGTQRTNVGTGILTLCDSMRYDINEYIHGTTNGEQMAQLLGALTIHGHTSGASTRLDEALGWFYGSIPGGKAAIETDRYFSADGGDGKGTWYSQFEKRYTLFALEAIVNGFSAFSVDSAAYSPFTDETWIAKVSEWFINTCYRGNGDYHSIGDTARTSNPWYHESTRHGFAILIRRGGFRKQMRWLHDQLQAKSLSLGQVSGYERAHEIFLWDPNDSNNASVAPKDASPAISKSRIFTPTGFYCGRDTWDYPNSCSIFLDCEQYYFRSHSHLSRGGIGISIKDDMVLLPSTGEYNTSDSAALFGGTHHRNWFQQSIAHSGVPLVFDSSQTHQNYASDNTLTTYPTGLGGQYWKRVSSKRSPADINEMRNDNSGLAWLCSSFEKVEDVEGSYTFLYQDIRRAYLEQYTDFGTATERVLMAEVKYLIIWGIPPWPLVLRLARIQSRASSLTKRDHYHFSRAPLVSPTDGRITAYGFKQTGKIVIDQYPAANFIYTTIGGGALDANGFGQNDFKYNLNAYPPAFAANYRHSPDIGKYRVEVQPVVNKTDDIFVSLLQPMGASDAPIQYSWKETSDYVGVSFNGLDWMIHKTNKLIITGATDTTPPLAPTGVSAATGSANGTVTVAWNPNTEPDLAGYNVYYRTSV